jgi:CheY-like chemotaxis protein
MSAFTNRFKTVIVAEDNPANLALLEEMIGGAGYKILGCRNGRECLDALDRVRPALILLDIQMPLLNGLDTCKAIRARADGRTVPIVFLTNRRTPEDVRAGLAAGATDFMPKPVSRDRLLERVRDWTSWMKEP